MLSRPHVLLSRDFFRIAFATLSRRTVAQHAGFRGSFAAGLSLVTFAISFRDLRFGFRGDSIGHPLYYFVLSGFMALLIWLGLFS